MKRIIVFIALLLACLPVCAQSKGDTFLGFGASFKASAIANNKGTTTESAFSGHGDIGWFVAKNFRLGCGFEMTFSPGDAGNNTQFVASPNLSYYFRIADGIYYAPELGMKFGIDIARLAMGYYTYCDLLAFEFRVKDDFALGINAGQCALASANNYSQFECLFNMGTISLRFYL